MSNEIEELKAQVLTLTAEKEALRAECNDTFMRILMICDIQDPATWEDRAKDMRQVASAGQRRTLDAETKELFRVLEAKLLSGNPSLVITTEDQAEASNLSVKENLLKAVTGLFREPVLPLSRVCAALETWAQCIREANSRETWVMDGSQVDVGAHGSSYVKHLADIAQDIRKSGLLERLLFMGQTVRTEPCPEHKGHMNAGMWIGIYNTPCPHGCEGSGWLPNKENPS